MGKKRAKIPFSVIVVPLLLTGCSYLPGICRPQTGSWSVNDISTINSSAQPEEIEQIANMNLYFSLIPVSILSFDVSDNCSVDGIVFNALDGETMFPIRPFSENGNIQITSNSFSKTVESGDLEFSIQGNFTSSTEAKGEFLIGEPVNLRFQWNAELEKE